MKNPSFTHLLFARLHKKWRKAPEFTNVCKEGIVEETKKKFKIPTGPGIDNMRCCRVLFCIVSICVKEIRKGLYEKDCLQLYSKQYIPCQRFNHRWWGIKSGKIINAKDFCVSTYVKHLQTIYLAPALVYRMKVFTKTVLLHKKETWKKKHMTKHNKPCAGSTTVLPDQKSHNIVQRGQDYCFSEQVIVHYKFADNNL